MCALCLGGIGPEALVPAPTPPDGWVVSMETPSTKKQQHTTRRELDGSDNLHKTSHRKVGNKHKQIHRKMNILSFLEKKEAADDKKEINVMILILD